MRYQQHSCAFHMLSISHRPYFLCMCTRICPVCSVCIYVCAGMQRLLSTHWHSQDSQGVFQWPHYLAVMRSALLSTQHKDMIVTLAFYEERQHFKVIQRPCKTIRVLLPSRLVTTFTYAG